jgi:ferrous iron transport protein B
LSPGTNKHIKVALLGNPNAGKTSLFNGLTGLNQKTGNYAGVTVDRHEGTAWFSENGTQYRLDVLDLPGVYSLYPKSTDEIIACRTLLDPAEQVEVVLVVTDATNLKRNLLLATQLLDLKFRTVIALNMIDEAEKQQIRIDVEGLKSTLGVEVVPVDSRRQVGFDRLKKAVTQARVSESVFRDISQPSLVETEYRDYIRTALDAGSDAATENSDKLYRFNIINYIIARYVKTPAQLAQKEVSARIDRIATHRVFGYLVLLGILFLVFQFIFFVSEKPMLWIEKVFIQFGQLVHQALPAGQLNDLLVDGVIAGVSGVVMFVPQIAFLFLFIGLLEDSGYMARAGFIMDRIMRPFGLNGRSVIPLISGTACAVPSIMATRAIGNLKERLITIFILPLVSCSARLPVYTLLISVLYPDRKLFGFFNSKGLVLMGLYLLGFVATLLTAWMLKRIIRIRESSFFVMEMPVYRWPQPRNIGLMVYNKVKVFVREAGLIILAISVVLWFLSAHGPDMSPVSKTREIASQPEVPVLSAGSQTDDDRLERSYIGMLGRAIEPVIAPLGFDWKIGIALLTSFAAREVFVGTMATIYKTGDKDNSEGIRDKLRKERTPDGKPQYSGAVCWSLLLFYAFALQCMSTVAVVKRETGSWKWVTLQFFFLFALAYGSAFAAYQLLS